MRQVELLAPAGNKEALYAAVQNGCDAVYLGGPLFGARAFADNFTKEELLEAVHYAHIYGVKVYITVNTLVHEDEIESAIDYVTFLQEADVDALIVQDFGLLHILLQQFPDMEVHASTQMHIHNEEAITFLKQQGVARVVVPRETPLAEIKRLSTLGVDLEVFVQGALCVSYSGQCLMSSVLFQRSGNRGACAQPCRMQYQLYKEEHGKACSVKSKGDYLLSPKDLNVLDHIGDLIDANVTSFKIEGRMKRPEYVAYIVSLYRQAIDAHIAGRSFRVTPTMVEQMEMLFHRGFTTGHIYHQMGSSLMNAIRPNHMGVFIGKVTKIQKDKMYIRLDHALDQGDGIRFLNEAGDEGFRVNRLYKQGLLISHADANDVIALDRMKGIKVNDRVVKTSAVHQLKALQDSYHNKQRKVKIHAAFQMQIDKEAVLQLWDEEGHCVTCLSSMVVEKAIKTPLSEDRIHQQLMKIKDTPYQIEDICFTLDANATIAISECNRMRRDAIDQLNSMRSIRNKDRKKVTISTTKGCVQANPFLYVVIQTIEQYRACKDMPVQCVIDRQELYQQLLDEDEGLWYRMPRVMKAPHLQQGISQDVGGLSKQAPLVYDTSCNVMNHVAGDFFFAHGAVCVILSWEVEVEDAKRIAKQAHGIYGYPVYGKRELMLSEYCIINAVEKDNNKKDCGLCKQHDYFMLDKKQRKFPILCDEYCRMHLLEDTACQRFDEISALQQAGIQQFLCVFTNEDEQVSRAVIKRVVSEVFHGN